MTAQIVIDKIASETITVPIVGTMPLIVHRFSEKKKRQMLEDQQGRKAPKKNRDPEADYQDAFHRLKSGEYGFPCLGFKAATVGAARFYGTSVKMTELRQTVFFHGEHADDGGQTLVAIEGEPRMREDIVRISMGKADLRYRPIFDEWTTTLLVTYVTSLLSRTSLLSLIDAGGMGVGVGEYRPQRGGENGTYMVDPSRDVEVIDR